MKNHTRFRLIGRRSWTVVVPAAVLLLCAVLSVVTAQDEAVRPAPRLLSQCDDIPGLSKPFTYRTADQMEVTRFIEMCALPEFGDLNINISGQVRGSVKLSVKGVTVGEALEIALGANNLAYEIRGRGERSIIDVMSDEEYRARHGVSFRENREVKIVELKFAKASRVRGVLDGVRSEIGKLIFDDVTGTLVLIDTPGKIAEMEAVIARSDIGTVERQLPTVTKIFRLQHAALADVKPQIEPLLTKEIGTMSVNEQAKTIVVTDLPHAIAKMEGVIAAFDRKRKQVAIQAKIFEVKLADANSLGVNWSHVIDNLDPRFKLSMASPFTAIRGGATDVQPPAQITYKTITGGGDLSAVVDALRTAGDTKIISSPQISVHDGEEASIRVVENQAYKEYALEPGTTNIVAVTYKFVEVGTVLSVTPKINDEGLISMEIKPTVSSISEWYDGLPQRGTPVIKKSEAATSISVKDGVMIVIGGMIQKRIEKQVSGVPFLSQIPLLGRAFRSSSEQEVRVETIVLLQPTIFSGEEPFLQVPNVEKNPKFQPSGEKEPKVRANGEKEPKAPANGDTQPAPEAAEPGDGNGAGKQKAPAKPAGEVAARR